MKDFKFEDLYKLIESRIKSKDKSSYSYQLSDNPKLLYKKILEEAKELTKTKNKNQVIWESSDLIYFLIVFLVKRQVKLEEIKSKLNERNKNKKKFKTK